MPHKIWRLSRKWLLPASKMADRTESHVTPHQRWLVSTRVVYSSKDGGILHMRLGQGKVRRPRRTPRLSKASLRLPEPSAVFRGVSRCGLPGWGVSGAGAAGTMWAAAPGGAGLSTRMPPGRETQENTKSSRNDSTGAAPSGTCPEPGAPAGERCGAGAGAGFARQGQRGEFQLPGSSR